jgi:LCP family protein required for cell wall assembly
MSRRNSRFTREDKRKLAVIIMILGMGLFVVAFFMKRWEDKKYATAGGVSTVDLQLANAAPSAYSYNDKIYIQREDVDAFLIMGIDKDGKVEKGKDAMDGGQADMIQVLVLDHSAKTMQLLSIDRNTLVFMEELDEAGNSLGIQYLPICLAHGYSYGLEDGCTKTSAIVQDLLLNKKMAGYYSLNMGGIATLNDLVGGVTVTVTEEFLEADPTLKLGETITLTGEQAESFVRARKGTNDPSNSKRMGRQDLYLQAFIKKFDELSVNEILEIYDAMMDYVVTNMGSGTFSNMAEKCKEYEKLDTITIKGTRQIEEGFETVRIDEQDRIETALKLFYRPETEGTGE